MDTNFRQKYIEGYWKKISKHIKRIDEEDQDFLHSIIENYTDREGNASTEQMAKRLSHKQYNRLKGISERL